MIGPVSVRPFLDRFRITSVLKKSQLSGQRTILTWSLISVLCLCLSGCGKSPNAVASSKSKAFDSAPVPIKQAWQTAAAAAKTNGYSAALIALAQIQSEPTLTSEQAAAVRELSTSLSDKMYQAANNGDASAKSALQDLRKLQSR
jgi:hypothetical protein